MASARIWRQRIAAWRASGLTAVEFAQARRLSAQQIWNWSWRFRKDAETAQARKVPAARVRSAAKHVRLARVVRVPAPVAAVAAAELVVELRGVRIAVPAGFDRATFSAVLDEVARRPQAAQP